MKKTRFTEPIVGILKERDAAAQRCCLSMLAIVRCDYGDTSLLEIRLRGQKRETRFGDALRLPSIKCGRYTPWGGSD